MNLTLFIFNNTLKGRQSDLIQKLGEVIENQHQQIDMLKRLLARVNKK